MLLVENQTGADSFLQVLTESSNYQRGPFLEVRNDPLADSEDQVTKPRGGGEARSDNKAAFVASVALIAQPLSACSNLPTTGAAAQYPDLNDPTSTAAAVRADELAQLKAELTRIRDDHDRAAAYQQVLP